MMGQTVADHLNEGAEQTNASSEKLKRRAASRKIGMQSRDKVIKRLDDEQKEFLERLRKHFLALRCNH
jgi:hypothetical protein